MWDCIVYFCLKGSGKSGNINAIVAGKSDHLLACENIVVFFHIQRVQKIDYRT